MFLHRFIITAAAVPLLIGCSLKSSHESSPYILVPPPALGNCKTQTFIEHRVGEGETIQDISELYFGKRDAWTNVAACNPDVDPIMLSAGTEVFIPVIQPKSKAVAAAKPAKSTKNTGPTVAKAPPPAVDEISITTVPVRGETTHASGDIPKAKSSLKVGTPEARTPTMAPIEEDFQVLPRVTTTVPVRAEPKVDPLPLEKPVPTIAPLPVKPAASQGLEGASLSSISPQSGSSLLLCTGKNCLPGNN